MHHKDTDRNEKQEDSAKQEQAAKRADAGVAPEQSEPEPEPDEVPEDVKRKDPPVPGQPKKIRVER